MRFLKEDSIEAYQWFKNGDHPKDDCDQLVGEDGEINNGEGHVVGFYPYPDDNTKICELCDKPYLDHGKIGIDLLFNRKNGTGPEIVCPGMWIRTYNIRHEQNGPEKYETLTVFSTKEYQDNARVKCITPPLVSEMEELKARFVFEVLINKHSYSVYDIPSRHHWNNTDSVSTWWLKYRGEGELEPWYDRHTHRVCYEFIIREHNHSKTKWDELRVSGGVSVEITANGKPYYSFGTSKLDYAFAKSQQLIVQMSEHPYNFLDPKSENGRKIYWYGLPAMVRPSSYPGEIAIIPDYSCGINKSEWWRIYLLRKEIVGGNLDDEEVKMDREDDDESMQSDYINWGDALSDDHIGWFRKEPKKQNNDPSANLSSQ